MEFRGQSAYAFPFYGFTNTPPWSIFTDDEINERIFNFVKIFVIGFVDILKNILGSQTKRNYLQIGKTGNCTSTDNILLCF